MSAMHVKVISFGILKDWLGSEAALIELEEGATIADLMRKLVADPRHGSRRELQLAGIAVGVNAEYATATRVLRDGDEVALLPPVSGGAPQTKEISSLKLQEMILGAVADDYENFNIIFAEVSKWIKNSDWATVDIDRVERDLKESIFLGDVQAFEYSENSNRYIQVEGELSQIQDLWFYITEQGKRRLNGPTEQVALTRECIDTEKLISAARCGEDGAIVVFDGMVRNNSRGRATLYLDYDAYEEMALGEMRRLAAEARDKFKVRQVTMVHRLGRLETGDTSVLIVVRSAHRAQAFDACRWLIDTLKQTVPIWKKETFADGAVWAPGEPFPAELQISAAEAKREE